MDTNLKATRWQDWGNLLVGASLFVSPWLLAYQADMPSIMWSAYLSGAAIVVFAAIAVLLPRAWEEGINTLLGVWLIASPWVLGFATDKYATWHAVLFGIVVGTLALWAMFYDKEFKKWRQDHHVAL